MWELHLDHMGEGRSPLKSSCLYGNQQKGGVTG